MALQPSIELFPEQISITVVLGTPLSCDSRYIDIFFFSNNVLRFIILSPSRFLMHIISADRPIVNANQKMPLLIISSYIFAAPIVRKSLFVFEKIKRGIPGMSGFSANA